MSGGVARLKDHLAGVKGNVAKSISALEVVIKEMRRYITSKKAIEEERQQRADVHDDLAHGHNPNLRIYPSSEEQSNGSSQEVVRQHERDYYHRDEDRELRDAIRVNKHMHEVEQTKCQSGAGGSV